MSDNDHLSTATEHMGGGLRVGQSCRVTSLRNTSVDGGAWVDWWPGRKKVFVVLILGIEPQRLEQKERMLDRRQALRDLGWVPGDEVASRERHLLDLLQRCRANLVEHGLEYHHVTPAELLKELDLELKP